MKIRILPEAVSDLQFASSFYESQSAGLGEYFADSLIADIDALAYFAGIHAMEHGFHRSLAKRFPFVIFYRINNEWVDIFAILDGRQDPAQIKQRLDGPRTMP